MLLPSQGPSPFENLPGEIRNQIYGYLLVYQHVETEDDGIKRARSKSPRPKAPNFHPAIIHTNKAINREASSFFYTKNPFITIQLRHFFRRAVSRIIGKFPTLRSNNVRQFPHAALHCQIIMTQHPHLSKNPECSALINNNNSNDPFQQLYQYTDRATINFIMLAHDLSILVASPAWEKYATICSYTTMKLCINPAFVQQQQQQQQQECAKNPANNLALTFGFFLKHLRKGSLEIGPRHENWETEADPDWPYYRSNSYGPFLYFWGKELVKMYEDSIEAPGNLDILLN